MTESTMSELNKTLQRTLNEYTQVGKDVRWLAEDIGEVAETAEALMKEISAKLEPVDLAAVHLVLFGMPRTGITAYVSFGGVIQADFPATSE